MKVKVFPAWQYRDPQEIIERLVVPTVARLPQPAQAEAGKRDRYYTMARRVVIRRATKQAMRGDR